MSLFDYLDFHPWWSLVLIAAMAALVETWAAYRRGGGE